MLMVCGIALIVFVISTSLLATPVNYDSPEKSLTIWVFIYTCMVTISFTQIMAFQTPRVIVNNNPGDSEGKLI